MAVAANCARKALQVASSSARTQLCLRSSNASNLTALSSASRVSSHNRFLSFSRLPKQLVGAQMSLIPLQSVTAIALFTSLLSLHNDKWGCLSEGFAAPL